jgi:hypothetical protein
MFIVPTDPQHGLIPPPLPIDEWPSFLQPVCVTWPHPHPTHFDPEEWGSKIFFSSNTVWCNNPQDYNMNAHCSADLKAYIPFKQFLGDKEISRRYET